MAPNRKQKRDYKAEYARRVTRGTAKGLSRSQARGHPKAKEKAVRKAKPIGDAALQIGLKELRSGKSLTEAARSIHVSPERLRNQAKERGAIKRKGRRWVIKNNLPRRMLIYSEGEAFPIIIGMSRHASKAGRYMAAVKKFLRTNNPAHLKPFIGNSITDIGGTAHVFETNPNAIYKLAHGNSESFEQVYRIIT